MNANRACGMKCLCPPVGGWAVGRPMRVISGAARGRRLKAPAGRLIRPTADRVKESLFNLLRVDWEGSRVLDLFAGSGALGIEALSRGARDAIFVEQDPVAIRLLRGNLEVCGMSGRARVVRAEVLRFLCRGLMGEPFQVIVADPPYSRGLAWGCVAAVDRGGWSAPGGIVAVEHSRREEMPCRCGRLTRVDQRVYGDTLISLYARLEGP